MLDYIALLIVPAAERPKCEATSQFPICTDDAGWKKNLWHLKHVPDLAKDAIRGMQPDQPVPGGILPLFALDQLSNVDKHRQPVVAAASLQYAYLANVPDRFKLSPPAWRYPESPVTDQGAEVARVVFSQPEPHVDMDVRFAYELAFFEEGVKRAPVVDTLRMIAFSVRYLIVEKLTPWLP